MSKLKAIVAVNELGYIGLNGKMPWHSPDDFKHFKKMTKDGIMIVGKVTFENDLGGKPLSGRIMQVVGKMADETREEELWSKNVYYNDTLWDAIEGAVGVAEHQNKQIWVMGGLSIYNQLWPLISELHLSVINDHTVGDRRLEIPRDFRGEIFQYNFDVSPKK